MKENAQPSLNPKTRKELALEFDVHHNTIAKWLKEAGINVFRRRLRREELIKFYNYLGWPDLGMIK